MKKRVMECVVTKGRLGDEDEARRVYWASRTIDERLAAVFELQELGTASFVDAEKLSDTKLTDRSIQCAVVRRRLAS